MGNNTGQPLKRKSTSGIGINTSRGVRHAGKKELIRFGETNSDSSGGGV